MVNAKKEEIKKRNESYWEGMVSVLSHAKRFRKAVVDARIKWEIPEKGLPHNKRAEWHASLYTFPNTKAKDNNYYTSTQNELLPPNERIRSTLKEISSQFNLDKRWHFSLFLHIASDDVPLSAPTGLPYVEVRLNDARLPKDQWVIERIWIEIYPDTTQDDIEAVWKQVELYQAMMSAQYPQKRRPLQNVDKYIKIRDLEDQQMTQQEIADDYPDLGFYSAKDVADFKKQIENRFSPHKSRK